jgi:hypothetical protein
VESQSTVVQNQFLWNCQLVSGLELVLFYFPIQAEKPCFLLSKTTETLFSKLEFLQSILLLVILLNSLLLLLLLLSPPLTCSCSLFYSISPDSWFSEPKVIALDTKYFVNLTDSLEIMQLLITLPDEPHPPPSLLKIAMEVTSGDPDLFVGLGYIPTPERYDIHDISSKQK